MEKQANRIFTLGIIFSTKLNRKNYAISDFLKIHPRFLTTNFKVKIKEET